MNAHSCMLTRKWGRLIFARGVSHPSLRPIQAFVGEVAKVPGVLSASVGDAAVMSWEPYAADVQVVLRVDAESARTTLPVLTMLVKRLMRSGKHPYVHEADVSTRHVNKRLPLGELEWTVDVYFVREDESYSSWAAG